ncbi:MAG: hypothetical protein NTW59_05215, partial [Candidatus Diapherotrites archaeon]|nr:hypothetical protein [Candidatus Diapherotrites archaeon]
GDYSAFYLQVGYDQNFKAKTFTQISDNKSPTEIKAHYNTIKAYTTKNPSKTIFARIYAKDKYGRETYSNKCEFGIKG